MCMCFISKLAYFCLPGMDGRCNCGRGCHSYLLTHELVQTQVDIDMPQMPVEKSNVTVIVCQLIVITTLLTFLSLWNLLVTL